VSVILTPENEVSLAEKESDLVVLLLKFVRLEIEKLSQQEHAVQPPQEVSTLLEGLSQQEHAVQPPQEVSTPLEWLSPVPTAMQQQLMWKKCVYLNTVLNQMKANDVSVQTVHALADLILECRKRQMQSEIGPTVAVTPQESDQSDLSKDSKDHVDHMVIISSFEPSTQAPQQSLPGQMLTHPLSLQSQLPPPPEVQLCELKIVAVSTSAPATSAPATSHKRKRDPPRESEKTTARKTNPKNKCKKPCANCGEEARSGVYLSLDKTGFVDEPDSEKSLIFCKPCVGIATEHKRGVKRVCKITRTDRKESTIHFCGHDHKAFVRDPNTKAPYFGGFSKKEVDGEVELFFAQCGKEPHQVTLKGIPFRKGYKREVFVFQKTPTACESHSYAVQADVSTVSKMDTQDTESDTESDNDEHFDVPV
jgi:hypothetical protein